MTVFLNHQRVRLALHTLLSAPGQPLLLLHGLGETSPPALPAEFSTWPGPVYALDFTGHGQSSVPGGGGYTAETLMADADAALLRLGPSTVVGRGLGAYVALMLAGARPRDVRGVILCDGPGLEGGGDRPGPAVIHPVPDQSEGADPFALLELANDVRPADYAASFAELAARGSGMEQPISIVATARPAWLTAVERQQGAVITTLDEALAAYANSQVR